MHKFTWCIVMGEKGLRRSSLISKERLSVLLRKGKIMTATKTPKAPTKSTAKGKGPKAGRSPIEWTSVMVDTTIAGQEEGIFLFEAGVYPSQKTEVEKAWIGPELPAKTAETKSKSANESSTEVTNATDSENKASTPEQGGGAMFLHVKEGKQLQSFPLSVEQLSAYNDFDAKFKAARGIHIRKIVPGTALAGIAHSNVYFLNPRAEVGDSLKAYRVLHELLYSSYQAIIGHYVHGKGSGFAPVAIMAIEEGLVMWQLPEVGASHSIDEAVDTPAWKKAVVTPEERALFSRLSSRLSRKKLDTAELRDPRRDLLQQLIEDKRASGEPPRSTTGKDFPTLLAALKAIVK